MVGLLQPLPLGSLLEMRAPALIDDAHNDDGRMVPVALDHASQRFHAPAFRVCRQLVPIRYFVPDENARLIGRLKIARVRYFDVASEQVEAQLFCPPHLRAQVIK